MGSCATNGEMSGLPRVFRRFFSPSFLLPKFVFPGVSSRPNSPFLCFGLNPLFEKQSLHSIQFIIHQNTVL